MGVRCDPLAEPVTQGLTKVTAPAWPAGSRGGERAERLRDQHEAERRLPRGQPAARQGRRRFAACRRATASRRETSSSPARRPALAARGGEADRRRLRRAAPSPVPASAYPLRKPRIAMYQRYGGGNMDEGWSRLMFEQFDIPVKPLMDAEIRKGDLNASYDAIILPADSIDRDDRRSAGRRRGGGRGGRGARPWRRRGRRARARQGGDAAGLPQRVRRRRRQDAAGVRAEGRHARHLRTGRRSADSALRPAAPQRRGRTAVEGVLVARIDAAGALRQPPSARVRHAARRAMRCSSPAARPTRSPPSSPNVEIFSTFVEREILQSGWLLGESVIAKKAAAVSVGHGDGRVVLLGFRPQHRDQTHGTFKLVFNALFNGPPAVTATSAAGARF